MKITGEIKKEINGGFALLFTVKAAILLLGYLMSFVLMKLTGSQPFYARVQADLNGYNSLAGILYNTSIYLLGAAVPLLFCLALRGKREPDTEDGLFLARPSLGQIGAALGPSVLIIGIVSNLSDRLFSFLYRLFGYRFEAAENELTRNIWGIAAFLIIISILPAITEEFIMRGEFLRRTRFFTRGSMIFLSGLCFMMMHNTLEQLPMSFAAGVCFAYYTLKFRSLWPAVISHFVVNLHSCVMTILFELFDGSELAFWYLVLSFMYWLTMIGLTIYGGIVFGISLPPDRRPKEERVSAFHVFRVPFFWLYLILFLVFVSLDVLMFIRIG